MDSIQQLPIVFDTKQCRTCGEVLPLSNFYSKPINAGGYSHQCKPCDIQRISKHQSAQPGRLSYYNYKSSIKRRFGMTMEEYEAMLDAQGGVCAICGSPPDQETRNKRLHIDHDHETGKVRALLCAGCNVALGGMKDNPGTLIAAAEYLRKHGK